jgi:hypothetical protein
MTVKNDVIKNDIVKRLFGAFRAFSTFERAPKVVSEHAPGDGEVTVFEAAAAQAFCTAFA